MSRHIYAMAFLTIAGCTLLSMSQARADVIFDSLGNSDNGTGDVANTLGASFSTPSSTTSLTDVKMILSNAGPAGQTIDVYLAADKATSPGSNLDLLGTVADSTLGTTGTLVDVPVTKIGLAADTRYWIVLSSPSSNAQWDYSFDNSGVGVPNEFWSDQGVFPNSEGPYLMEITVSSPVAPVPEPAGAILLCTGLVAMAASRHRQPKAAA